METVREVVNSASVKLDSTSDEPRIDAEYLMRYLTGFSATQLIVNAEQVINTNGVTRFWRLVERRLNGEPIAYITKRKDFHEISLSVNSDVLIPRSDTELLVEQALMLIPLKRSVSVLDLGTGSGAIALSIASQRPQAEIIAIDNSAAACEVAEKNAVTLEQDNVDILCGSWFEPVAQSVFNVIVSNPPYIAEGDPHLSSGDLRFEPQTALVAPDNGLACFKHIAANAKDHLVTGGSLLFEHGLDQGAAVRQILADHEFANIHTYQDLSGHDRVTVGASS